MSMPLNVSSIPTANAPVMSRFLCTSIQGSWIYKKMELRSSQNTHLKQGWLVTNTRFTTDAINYGNCIGLTLLSWDHPKNNGIPRHVDQFGLYPITTLTTLSKQEKRQLLDRGVILTMEIEQQPGILKELHLSSGKTIEVLSEVHQLCHL